MVVRSDRDLALPETVPGEERPISIDDGASFSGHERNHLFVNRDRRFVEASAVSGLDDPADGRAFGILDFDHDGWSDLAVVNANAPLLELFRNETGALVDAGSGRSVAVRLVGGNREAASSDSWSARDGYGAKVRVVVGERVLLREHLCGEGMAAQNSATMLVGIGSADAADAIEVTWPSGRTSRSDRIRAGSLVTVYENPADSPGGDGFDVRPYRAGPVPPVALEAHVDEPPGPRLGLDLARAPTRARINMYTTMATWCATCRFELPHLALLREEFSYAELAMLGVPTDPSDGSAKLRAYVEEHAPAYGLLIDIPADERSAVQALVEGALGAAVLPSTVLTDGRGHVLEVLAGSPTVSDLRRLMGECCDADAMSARIGGP